MIKLSELDPELSVEDLIDFLLDMKVYKVINDLSDKKPYIEYGLNDLYEVWDNLRILLYFY